MMVGTNLTDVQLQQIVDKSILEADSDGDGKVSFEDFVKVYLPLPHISLSPTPPSPLHLSPSPFLSPIPSFLPSAYGKAHVGHLLALPGLCALVSLVYLFTLLQIYLPLSAL